MCFPFICSKYVPWMLKFMCPLFSTIIVLVRTTFDFEELVITAG